MLLNRTLPVLAALAVASAPVLAAEKPAPRTEVDRPAAEEQDTGLGALHHATPEQVRARLGDPDVSRAEGKGGFWTYRLPHCALYLFFRETTVKGKAGLRVSGASTGARKRGEPAPSVEACLASAVQLPDPS